MVRPGRNANIIKQKRMKFKFSPNSCDPIKVTVPSNTPSPQAEENTKCSEVKLIMTNKACLVVPDHRDMAQYTSKSFRKLSSSENTKHLSNSVSWNEQYQSMLIKQYGFNPFEPKTKSYPVVGPVIPNKTAKVENSSQCANPTTTNTGTNGTALESGFNFGDCDNHKGFSRKHVEISNVPRLKVIAEKYTRYKEDPIEVRRLEERVICVEYDVYSSEDGTKKVVQVMRAFFCIKTGCENCKGTFINNLPYTIRTCEEKCREKIEKEVEIIDEQLPENKMYLQDLRRVLKKRRAMRIKKHKSSLDLISLYNMAYNETPIRDHDFSHTNLLSKAELEEVKHLILKNCDSRVNHFNRKKIKDKGNNVVVQQSNEFSGAAESLCFDLLCDFKSCVC